MVIDEIDFDGLAPTQAALKLHRMKGADMMWHLGILFLVIVAMFVADVSPVVSVSVQYWLIFIGFRNIEATHAKRLDAWLGGYIRSFAEAKQGGES